MNIMFIVIFIFAVFMAAILAVLFIKRKALKAKILEEEAAKGNPDIQLALGLMFLSGAHVEKDKEKGKIYIRKAADAGNAQAQFLYSGIILSESEPHTPEQLAEAAMWIEKSANGGFLRAMTTLANMYADGKVIKRDTEKSFYWFDAAAKKGDVTAQVTAAGIYHLSMDKDRKTAYAWYMTAAASGNEYAKEQGEKLFKEFNSDEQRDAEKIADKYIALYAKNAAG